MNSTATSLITAIGMAPPDGLDSLRRELWDHYGAGRIGDDEASRISAVLQERAGQQAARRPTPRGPRPMGQMPCVLRVRARSHLKGTVEGGLWAPIRRQHLEAILKAAQRSLTAREISPHASVLITCLISLTNLETGRLEPTIQTMARYTSLSPTTVKKGLSRLRDQGFLTWERRYVRIANAGFGPQIRQTSNAYCLLLPQKNRMEQERALVARARRNAPLPCDARTALEMRTDDIAGYMKAMSLEERITHAFDEHALGDSLIKLGNAIAARTRLTREATSGPQITLKYNIKGRSQLEMARKERQNSS